MLRARRADALPAEDVLRPTAARAARILLPALLALAGAASFAGAPGPEAPARGDAAARLPAGEDASEAWEWVARFESGHLLLARAVVTNLGIGDRKAAVVGFVVDPDDRVVPFRRTEDEDGWRLSADRRELDLRSIVVRAGPPPRRLVVDKDEIEVELDLAGQGAPRAPEGLVPGCPFDLLELSSPATGRFWTEAMDAAVALRGRGAVTHRWNEALEARCVTRRVEVFAFGDAPAVYFTEILRPDGQVRRWAAVRRADGTAWSGVPEEARVRWEPDPEGFAQPSSLRVVLPDGVLQVDVSPPVAEVDVLARVPALARPLVALRTRPRVRLSRATWGLGDGRRRPGLVEVSHLNPLDGPSATP